MSGKAKSTEIRGNWKMRMGGKLGGLLLKMLGVTLRFRTVDPEGVLERITGDGAPVIYCLWHNQMLSGMLTTRRFARSNRVAVLTSASKDGAALEALAESMGYGAVRGSSSRRGMQAMMALKRAIGGGQDAAITPDGPRGPRYDLQAGVVKLAQATGAPIVTLRYENGSTWRLKTWDRLRIPKPFSTMTLILNPPLEVPRRLEEDRFEAIRAELEKRMREGIDDLISKNDDDH